MINISQLYTELLKRGGKQWTYVKVKCALDGIPETTTDKEKIELIRVMTDTFKQLKTNIQNS